MSGGGDLDVTMRLRLVQDVDKEAKRAKEGIKDLDKAIDALGKGSRSNLDRGIEKLASSARKGVSAVKSLETEVKKLDAVNTNKAETEVKQLARTSTVVGRTIGQALARAQQEADMFNTERAQQKNQIRNESAGAVNTDNDFLSTMPAERNARRNQALQAHLQDMGTYLWDNILEPSWDRIVRSGSPEYDRQRLDEELPENLKQNALERLDLENQILSLRGQKGRKGGLVDGEIDTIIEALQMQIDLLKAAEADYLERQGQLNPEQKVDPTTTKSIGDKPVTASKKSSDYIPSGKIPAPIDRPVEAAVGKDMSGAAEKSMSGYNSALDAAGNRAVSIAEGIAAKLKSVLSFTATPTISPNMVNPGSTNTTTKSVPGKQSSISSTTSTKVTQNIYSPSSVRAARLAQREQDKAVRMARNRALADTGSMPA